MAMELEALYGSGGLTVAFGTLDHYSVSLFAFSERSDGAEVRAFAGSGAISDAFSQQRPFMDVMRGAVVGATFGALIAYGARTFAAASDVDDGIIESMPMLARVPLVAASMKRLSELREASPEAAELYADMLARCNELLEAEAGLHPNLSQFRINRTCCDFKRGLKQLCAKAGENRAFMDTARQLVATESEILDDFCEKYLHNMVLGR